MKKILLVIDMQKDFVDGSLGTKEAQEIVPAVVKKVRDFQGELIFTMDTHAPEYLKTQEGRNLPVEHCIKGTPGHEIIPELQPFTENAKVFEKITFGSVDLCAYLKSIEKEIESIELVGLCTDIGVISNALLLKAAMPEIPMSVDAGCCAGVTPEKHEAALETMRSCQVAVH